MPSKTFDINLREEVRQNFRARIAAGPVAGREIIEPVKAWMREVKSLNRSAEFIFNNTEIATTWKEGITYLSTISQFFNYVSEQQDAKSLNIEFLKRRAASSAEALQLAKKFAISNKILENEVISGCDENARKSAQTITIEVIKFLREPHPPNSRRVLQIVAEVPIVQF